MSYPYEKHIWVTKELIRREYLQNIEDGIYDEQQARLLAEEGISADIAAEELRAKGAEQSLSGNITDANDRIAAETTRATIAEGNLGISIESETTRAINAENSIRTYVDQKISTIYIPSGSVYFADLPQAEASTVGHVYDIKDAFTTTSQFTEGAGHDYPAGTNVAIVERTVESYTYTAVEPTGEENPVEEGWYELVDTDYVLSQDTTVDSEKTYYEQNEVTEIIYLYDAMAGFIDTSNFVQKTDKATTSALGIVKVDGTTITVDSDGTIHSSGSGHGSVEDVEIMIAPVEADDTSSTNAYVVGKRLITNDILYEVISPISVGDALIAYEDDPSSANIKQTNAITDFDTTPTQNSTKFVTSGGVYSYIDTMITQAISASY